MGLVGNILWFIFGGFFSFLAYALASIALAITLIGIPFAIQTFKLGVAMLAPFGREVRPNPDADRPLNTIFNVLWLIVFGWEIALHHLFWAFIFTVTIIGIPFALQHVKLAFLALWPFGRSFDRRAPMPDF